MQGLTQETVPCPERTYVFRMTHAVNKNDFSSQHSLIGLYDGSTLCAL